jgi:hypothetical protein
MDRIDLTALLANATEDTILHVEYIAGRPASDQAIEEYHQASDWNKKSTSYIGHFKGLRRTKKGEMLLTLFVHNRGEAGAYRAFNPSLGTLLSVKVVAN